MLRTALAMGLAPDAFWRLSLREWRMLTGAPAGSTPLSRTEFERMREVWPDDG
ncbi:phage tail assembly chaperone [Brevundimonas sp. VNH65]|uniref:phage tail assembly chaperone n=1 Tax=Brevundimonas sp. VNH65 TaxID=3400917 RepID=UPI003C1030F2